MTTLLAIIAAALPTYLVRFEVVGIPSTLLEVLIWALFGVGLVHVARDRASRLRLIKRRVWLIPAALLLIGATVGVAIAPDLRVALGLWKGFILDPILVYVLALAFLATTADRERVVYGLVGGATGIALWALFGGWADGGGRFLGPYGLEANASPNYLAFAVAPVLPLVIHLTRRYWLWSSVALVLVAALVASGSRAGLLAGVGGLVVAGILSAEQFWRSRVAKTIFVLGLFAATAASWLVVRPDFSLSPETGGRTTASTNVRFQLWSATGELVQLHPFLGLGLGNFQAAFADRTAGRVNYPEFITPEARTPHNTAVSLWMDATLLGLLAYFAGLVLVGRTLFAAVRTANDRALAAALLGSWFALLAQGTLDTPIWKNDGMVLFWLLVAVSVPVIIRRDRAATR